VEVHCVRDVFLAGFKWLAIFAFPALLIGAWLVIRKHPRMFQLWTLSLKQKSDYDPRKERTVVYQGRSGERHHAPLALRRPA
jgi:hypothetical protein